MKKCCLLISLSDIFLCGCAAAATSTLQQKRSPCVVSWKKIITSRFPGTFGFGQLYDKWIGELDEEKLFSHRPR